MNFPLFCDVLKKNPYPGRGIAVGKSCDGKSAAIFYFIMGRSENSRNRIFSATQDGIETRAFDISKLKDPSLIIYPPVRVFEDTTIISNGDQTNTIFDAISSGKTFEDALEIREFENDPPHFTPRISAILKIQNADINFSMSILKKNVTNDFCDRFFFQYKSIEAGCAKFLHTYENCDGEILQSFLGEPLTVSFSGNIDDASLAVWNALNEQNKISLFVRYINLQNQKIENRIFNKNEK